MHSMSLVNLCRMCFQCSGFYVCLKYKIKPHEIFESNTQIWFVAHSKLFKITRYYARLWLQTILLCTVQPNYLVTIHTFYLIWCSPDDEMNECSVSSFNSGKTHSIANETSNDSQLWSAAVYWNWPIAIYWFCVENENVENVRRSEQSFGSWYQFLRSYEIGRVDFLIGPIHSFFFFWVMFSVFLNFFFSGIWHRGLSVTLQ